MNDMAVMAAMAATAMFRDAPAWCLRRRLTIELHSPKFCHQLSSETVVYMGPAAVKLQYR